MCVLDHSTVAGVDKFGNVFTLRVPDDVNEDLEGGGSGAALLWEQAAGGSQNKLELLTHYYLGERHNISCLFSVVPCLIIIVCAAKRAERVLSIDDF